MAGLLDPLRKALKEAAMEAALAVQAEMDREMLYAMYDHPWEWHGIKHDDSRTGYPYGNGNLSQSKEMSEVFEVVNGNKHSLVFSFKWDPVDPDSGRHYAALVHDGSKKDVLYTVNEEHPFITYKPYSARPWTAWVTPPSQRKNITIESGHTKPTSGKIADTGWRNVEKVFVDTLNGAFKRNYASRPVNITLQLQVR
jgi:hypothetical protein